MDISLTPYEARVIGSLIEKEITTPDQYPLSLNALASACNQKSNREPVLELDEATIQQTVDALVKKALVSDKTGYGSRTTKYRHRFCNTEFGLLKFSERELGIVCALLLRGPQTPGELRTHTSRLCQFNDMEEVEATLMQLMERSDGPFVAKLPREPGKRESRYMHLFSGDAPAQGTPGGADDALDGAERERLVELELRVGELEQEVARLGRELERLAPKAVAGGTEA
ncbi:MAG: DUF480 domain-containing protein [Sulfuricella sp.]|nr:DUF480 domain-containing protein [Sulfuricella sp.]